MAVVTPDGIVGKVIAAYPTASEVLLVTDPDFAAGVVSQKNHVRGTLKGQGRPTCKVDYVPSEEKVEAGEMFYTSGDDRIFPRGFRWGWCGWCGPGRRFRRSWSSRAGIEHGLEDVLIVLEGVHQAIPEAPPANEPVYLGTPPPPAPGEQAAQPSSPVGTDADKLLRKYHEIGAAENHKYGEGPPGSKPPDFNIKLPANPGAAVARPGDAANPAGGPSPNRPGAATTPPNPNATSKTGVAAPAHHPAPAHSAGAASAMTEYSDRYLVGNQREQVSRFRARVMLLVPLAAILYQVYVPRFWDVLGLFDLPLLVTIYFALMRRSQIGGLFIGAFIGLAQDSLTIKQPLGMFGIVKTSSRLFRRIGGHAHRRGAFRDPVSADTFLLFLPSASLLGAGAGFIGTPDSI